MQRGEEDVAGPNRVHDSAGRHRTVLHQATTAERQPSPATGTRTQPCPQPCLGQRLNRNLVAPGEPALAPMAISFEVLEDRATNQPGRPQIHAGRPE